MLYGHGPQFYPGKVDRGRSCKRLAIYASEQFYCIGPTKWLHIDHKADLTCIVIGVTNLVELTYEPSFSAFHQVDVEVVEHCWTLLARCMTGQIAIADCSHLVGHVKHEMMHIMGFYHEHSRYHCISKRIQISKCTGFRLVLRIRLHTILHLKLRGCVCCPILGVNSYQYFKTKCITSA